MISYDLGLKYSVGFFLVTLAACLRADDVSDAAKKADTLIDAHRRAVNRVLPAAHATMQSLLTRAHLYVLEAPDPGFAREASSPGGLVCAGRLNAAETTIKGRDVVWMSYNAASYDAVKAKSAEFRARGAITVGFGPKPPDSDAFTYWIDSMTAWQDKAGFTLLANALSLWELTGELTNIAASNGRTLGVLASKFSEEGKRNPREGVFSDRHTQIPVEEGALARQYLDGVARIFETIRHEELGKIRAAGSQIASALKLGRAIGFTAAGALIESAEGHEAAGLEYFPRAVSGDAIIGSLGRRPLFLYLGYLPGREPYAALRQLRADGADVIWVGIEPEDGSAVARNGEVFIGQHWALEDALVRPPGSTLPILPPSGVTMLYTFELMRAASGGFGSTRESPAPRQLTRRDGTAAEGETHTPSDDGKPRQPRDPGEIAEEALMLATTGQLERGLALFNAENFPDEKQPKVVREALMELRLQQLLRRTSCARLDVTLDGLDGYVSTLPFTFRGLGGFVDSARAQYLIAVLEYSCGFESAARKRWEKVSKMRPSLASVDFAYPYLALSHLNMQRAQAEARRPFQQVKDAVGGNTDAPRAVLLYHQGLFLSLAGKLEDAARSFKEGARAGSGTYAGYLNLNALPSTKTGAPIGVTQLAPGVWFREGIPAEESASTANRKSTECNQVLIEMADYAILVDAGSPYGARAAMIDFRRVTTKPILVVFNTHHHGDHAYGNSFWISLGAKVLAYAGVTSELSRYEPRRLKNSGVDALQLKSVSYPTQTFDGDTFVIEDATRRVEFRYFGAAHTKGDAVVYLPKERILCAGDVVVNGPYNFTEDADLQNWPKVIEKIMALDVEKVVPGHGPAGGAELLEGQRSFLVQLLRFAHEMNTHPRYSPEVARWVGSPARVEEQLNDAIWEVRNQKPRGDADPASRR